MKNVTPYDVRRSLLADVARATVYSGNRGLHGSTITCTIAECSNPATREPLPRSNGGRPSGIPHAHYATPMTVDIGRNATILVGGIEFMNGVRRRGR